MNDAHTKMTFRFGEAVQKNEGKYEQRLAELEETMKGTVITERDRTSLSMKSRENHPLTEHQSPDVDEHAEPVMKRNDDKVESWTRKINPSNHEFLPNGYLLAPAIEDPAGGSLGNYQGEFIGYNAYTRSWKPPLWRVVASVAGALATGTLFGFLVLSFFQREVSMLNLNDTVPTFARDQRVKGERETAKFISQSKAITGNSVGKSNTARESGSSTAAELYVTKVNIPEKVFYMLQYGVFAQADGAQKAVSELRERGMAAVEENLDQHRVYTAIAPSREDAMALSLLIKNQQVNVYIRALHRPAVTKLGFRGDAAAIERFIAQSDTVNAWLMSQSIAYLEKNAVKAFLPDLKEQLRREHLKWTQQMGVVEKGIPERSKISWNKLVRGMNMAISALNEYNKRPSCSHLWNMQQAAMTYRAAETEWLETMKT